MGASLFADAFFVAFRLPNTFRRLFAEGTFNAAFIPSYTSAKLKNNQTGKIFADDVLSGLSYAIKLYFLLFSILILIFTNNEFLVTNSGIFFIDYFLDNYIISFIVTFFIIFLIFQRVKSA